VLEPLLFHDEFSRYQVLLQSPLVVRLRLATLPAHRRLPELRYRPIFRHREAVLACARIRQRLVSRAPTLLVPYAIVHQLRADRAPLKLRRL